MEAARTNRRKAVILSAVGLVGVAAMTGIAIAGNVDWGPPGSPSYATYQLVNRLTGLALAFLVAAPLALRVALASWGPRMEVAHRRHRGRDCPVRHGRRQRPRVLGIIQARLRPSLPGP